MVPISQMGNWKLMTNIPRVLEARTGALAVWRRSPGRVVQKPRLGGTNRLLVLGRKQQEVWPLQLQCAGAEESQTSPSTTFSVITLSDTMVTMLSAKAGPIQA